MTLPNKNFISAVGICKAAIVVWAKHFFSHCGLLQTTDDVNTMHRGMWQWEQYQLKTRVTWFLPLILKEKAMRGLCAQWCRAAFRVSERFGTVSDFYTSTVGGLCLSAWMLAWAHTRFGSRSFTHTHTHTHTHTPLAICSQQVSSADPCFPETSGHCPLNALARADETGPDCSHARIFIQCLL